MDGLQWDGLVKCGESAVIADGQAKQIYIRDFLVSADHRWAKQRLIEQRYRVWPEMMIRGSERPLHASGYFCGSCVQARIAGTAQDANRAVDRDRAGRPSVFAIQTEPAVSVIVVDVGRIEQRDQYVHIEEGNTHSSSRSRFTNSMSALGAPGFGVRSKIPLRTFAGAVAARDKRAKLEMKWPRDTPCWRANGLAAARRSSSRSSVVRMFLLYRITHHSL